MRRRDMKSIVQPVPNSRHPQLRVKTISTILKNCIDFRDTMISFVPHFHSGNGVMRYMYGLCRSASEVIALKRTIKRVRQRSQHTFLLGYFEISRVFGHGSDI